MPRTHTWTRTQKWLILAAATAALASLGVGIYVYERNYRGPTDSVLVGSWAFPPLDGEDIYFRVDADHTFRVYIDPAEAGPGWRRGVWFGGGSFVYFRANTLDDDGFVTDHPLWIWRLENIQPNELQVRLNPGGIPRTVRRVSPQSQ
jgi:hypothetical protein